MIDRYKEGIDDFIENHLDRRDFAFLVLPRDERLRHQAMTEIKDKFWEFWDAREDKSHTVGDWLANQQTPLYSLDNFNDKEEL